MARVVYILFFLLLHVILVANTVCDDDKDVILYDSIQYLNFAFLPEAALELSSDYLNDPNFGKLKDCKLHYSIKYEIGLAYQLSADYSNGLDYLHKLVNDCHKNGFYEIEAESYLTIALIHEFLGRMKDCKRNMDKALSTINEYDVTESFPRYCVRFSSYNRIIRNNILAKEYAEKAIKSAKEIGDVDNELDGYLLLGGLVKDPNEAVKNFERSSDLFLLRDGYIGASSQTLNAARILLDNEKYSKANEYMDKAYTYLSSVADYNKDYYNDLSYYYQLKKEVYIKNDRLDSAMHYSELYGSVLPKTITNTDHNLINEAETKFQVSLEKQKSEAADYRSQVFKYIIYGGSLLFLMMSVMGYFLFRNRNKISKQNKLISSQLMLLLEEKGKSDQLLSEVHHRVKNNLQNMISLLLFKGNTLVEPGEKALLEDMKGKIMSLSIIHENLYKSGELNKLEVKTYFENFVNYANQSFEGNNFSCNLDIDIEYLNFDTMIPIGLMTAELLSNASKFGKDEDDSLKLDISMKLNHENMIQFDVKDHGIGYPDSVLNESKISTGISIIKSMTRQLKGVSVFKNSGGAFFSFVFAEKTVSKV